jgi:hypothetical protein
MTKYLVQTPRGPEAYFDILEAQNEAARHARPGQDPSELISEDPDEVECSRCGETIHREEAHPDTGRCMGCQEGATLLTYEVAIDGGQGGDTEIEAYDLEEAWEEAVSWARDGGYWPSKGCVIHLRVTSVEDPAEERHDEIEIPPDHDALIEAAGGNPYCDHKWTSEGEGGCDSNPGVWSLGGTTYLYRSHCAVCGLRRTITEYGSQRNPGQADSVIYEMPEVE